MLERPDGALAAKALGAYRGKLEPAENYLAITGDTSVTAASCNSH
jgi:hypothetical protein